MLTIAHAAALTDEDLVPFEHGVALARASGAKLRSIHAAQSGDGDARPLDAADVLARWGDSSARVDATLMIHDCCEDPVDTLLDALSKVGPDLVVAGTHQREGLARVLIGSRAEAIAQNVSVPTLLLPIGVDGFVSRETGEISLRKILVPIGDSVEARSAMEAAKALSLMAGVADEVELQRLHVEGGDLEAAIIEEARHADLIVMATRGHDSLGDVLRGSHTDRVLHRARCPLLSVPVLEP